VDGFRPKNGKFEKPKVDQYSHLDGL